MKDGTRDIPEIATLPPDLVDVDIRRARRIRSVALVLLCALVLAGLAGLLGVHSATTSASANGYTMYVKYPLVARSGLDADWSVRVTVPAGTSGPITLALPKNYVQLFDLQDIVPEPATQASAPPYLLGAALLRC